MDRREPTDPIKHTEMRWCAPQFTLQSNQLYRRSLDNILLRCVSTNVVNKVINKVHVGVCGGHQSGPKLKYQLKRLGYYWLTMVVNCIEYAKWCHICQWQSDYGHVPAEPLHTTSCSWSFSKWGMDIVGSITPTSTKEHRYILASTDYFSKWEEAIALLEIKAFDIVWFIKVHLIYRFGVPDHIIIDNGQLFVSSPLYRLMAKYNINLEHSSYYYPQANGLAKTFNKTLCKIIKKMVSRHKKDWHECLHEVL